MAGFNQSYCITTVSIYILRIPKFINDINGESVTHLTIDS